MHTAQLFQTLVGSWNSGHWPSSFAIPDTGRLWYEPLSPACRYLKYLTKKFLKKHNVRDWLRVIASNKDAKYAPPCYQPHVDNNQSTKLVCSSFE
jgi:hypothetical protein